MSSRAFVHRFSCADGHHLKSRNQCAGYPGNTDHFKIDGTENGVSTAKDVEAPCLGRAERPAIDA